MKQKKSYMKTNNTRFLLSSLVMCTLFCGSILGFYSCSIAPTLSKFPMSDIRLGLNKSDVKKGSSVKCVDTFCIALKEKMKLLIKQKHS